MTAVAPTAAERRSLPSDFSLWTLTDVKSVIQTAVAEGPGRTGFRANAAFVEDRDHWQNGTTWVGPTGDDSVKDLVLQGVKRQFTPVDVIGEVLDRVVNGLVKREPDVQFVPRQPGGADGDTEAQAAEADAMLALISDWWDRVKLWGEDNVRAAVRRSRWAGRGALRLYIPSGQLADDGEKTVFPTGLTWAEAFARIQCEAPAPDDVLVYTDPVSQRTIAMALTTDMEGQELAELWYRDGDDLVFRTVGRDGAATYQVPGVRRLPIAEMAAQVLITEPVRRQQNRLNFFESMLVRVGETAGFPERYLINSAPSGIWLKTAPASSTNPVTRTDDSGVVWYLHEIPRSLGAAIATELRGFPYPTDNAGGQSVTTPSVTIKEPTDPDYAVRACDHARRTILRSCKQGHLALDSAGETSGLAYQQARADFEDDLAATKGPLEGLLRETIEAAIALADAMGSGREEGPVRRNFLERYRCVVNLHIHTGPVLPEEQIAISTVAQQGLLARSSAMARLGVEDVAAELTALAEDPQAQAKLAGQQAIAVQAWVAAGVAIDVAAELAGLSAEDAAKLLAPQDPTRFPVQP